MSFIGTSLSGPQKSGPRRNSEVLKISDQVLTFSFRAKQKSELADIAEIANPASDLNQNLLKRVTRLYHRPVPATPWPSSFLIFDWRARSPLRPGGQSPHL